TRNQDLHLVYASVEQTGRRLKALTSSIRMIQSTDGGDTWSEPHTISPEARRSRWFVDGYQGAALVEAPTGALFVSWADYYGNGVNCSVRPRPRGGFDTPTRALLPRSHAAGALGWMLGASYGTPATELAVEDTGEHIVISI